ncbi:MAG: anion permease [Bacillota bacterium]|nr:anion permease [Bacillota bacterium]
MKNIKQTIALIMALVVLAAFMLVPLIMWIGVSIDWPSLITVFLVGLLTSYGFTSTLSKTFGNSTVAFLMFTFILVYPLSKTNFVRRTTIAFITNKIASKGPWHFVSFLFAAEMILGLFISPSVLFVAFVPFLEDIYSVLGLNKGSKAANMIMLGSVFTIGLSSGMTPIGHVWPTMAMGYLTDANGAPLINSFQFMAMGIPTGIIILVLMILMFKLLYRPDDINEIDPTKALSLKGSVPKADAKEKLILGVMILVILLWIVPSLLKSVLPTFYSKINGMTTAMPPLLGCIILFLTRFDGEQILSFKEAMTKGVMWGGIFMTGAATLVGGCLTDANIGINTWLSGVMQPIASGLSPALLVVFFVVWTIIETNFSSNIVTTTVVSSIALAVLSALPDGTICVPAIICLVGFGAGISNMAPAGQPTNNPVAIGSGYTDAKSMFIWGGIFSIISIVVMCTVGYGIASMVM